MGFGIKLKGLTSDMFKSLDSSLMLGAYRDAAQVIVNSTLMGYVTRTAPDGSPWKPNAIWWSEMKGQTSPLTGPITSTIKGGRSAGRYKLAKVNAKRMKNSLKTIIKSDSALIEYDSDVKERARITQFGLESEMRLVSLTGGADLVFNVKNIERPHLGVATGPRIAPYPDAVWIERIFGDKVQTKLEG